MTADITFTPGQQVMVKCFSFSNPSSINGPFGTFQLWIEENGSGVAGRMTIQTLFGMPATQTLNLTGSRSGTNPIICSLDGEGIYASFGSNPLSIDQVMSIEFSSDWSTGSLVFSAEPSSHGLPVTEVACTGAS